MIEGSRLPFGGSVSWFGNNIVFWVLSSVTVLCPCVLGTRLRHLLFSPCVCSQRCFVAYHSLQAYMCVKNTGLKKKRVFVYTVFTDSVYR